MAKRTIHILVDDLDGGDANETVRFAVDRAQYEIDLSTKNATRLRQALAPFVNAATKLGRGPGAPTGRPPGRPGVRARVDADQNRAIRAWAHSKGNPPTAGSSPSTTAPTTRSCDR